MCDRLANSPVSQSQHGSVRDPELAYMPNYLDKVVSDPERLPDPLAFSALQIAGQRERSSDEVHLSRFVGASWRVRAVELGDFCHVKTEIAFQKNFKTIYTIK